MVPEIHDTDDVDITLCPICGESLRVSAASWHVDTCLLRSDILKRKTTARNDCQAELVQADGHCAIATP